VQTGMLTNKLLTVFIMNKTCIRKIYKEYLEEYLPNMTPSNPFVMDQSIKHSCDVGDIENLIYIYGSYLARQEAIASGITIHYDKYSMLCFKILDELNGIEEPKRYWWQFWK